MKRAKILIVCLLTVGLSSLSGGAAMLILDNVAAVNGRPGMNIEAHYDLGTDFTCCSPDNLRWIQDVHVTDNAGHPKQLLGTFPSDFIDPQPGQNIGDDYDGNPQTGDTLPWYDVTRNQAAKTGAFQRGAGAFFEDAPGGTAFNDEAPIRVDFNTLVVCMDEGTHTFFALGGFSWGFIIDPKNSNPQLLSVMALSGDSLINEFNGLLAPTFDPWRMITAGDCDFTVVVPEASTYYVGAFLVLPFALQGLRRYQHLYCKQAA